MWKGSAVLKKPSAPLVHLSSSTRGLSQLTCRVDSCCGSNSVAEHCAVLSCTSLFRSASTMSKKSQYDSLSIYDCLSLPKAESAAGTLPTGKMAAAQSRTTRARVSYASCPRDEIYFCREFCHSRVSVC